MTTPVATPIPAPAPVAPAPAATPAPAAPAAGTPALSPAAAPAAPSETPAPAISSSLLGRKPAAAAEAPAADSADFTVNDNQLFDTEVLKAFSTTVGELKISRDAAQQLLDRVAPVVQGQMVAAAVAREKSWAAEVETDKELGGTNIDGTVTSMQRALEAIGSPELIDLLNRSGLGSNIHVARALVKVDRAINPRALERGVPPPANKAQPKTLADVLYPAKS